MDSTLKRKILAYGLTFDGHSNGVEKTGGQKIRGDDDARFSRGPSLKMYRCYWEHQNRLLLPFVT